jgi:murein DD-endopeptidase MepM/ murein hydrolase activator NlpD
MTQNKKILNRKQQAEAKEQKKKNKFPNGEHRTQPVVMTTAYLFLPMIFATPTPTPTTNFTLTPQSSPPSIVEMFNGRGGPEELPPPNLNAQEALEKVFEEETSQYEIFSKEKVAPTTTQIVNHLKVANTTMPTTSPEVTSKYGWRTPPCKGCSADHKGIDFVPGEGTPVFAVADGIVTDMGSNGGYGNYVKMRHLIANSDGVIEEWETLYAHMKNKSFPEEMMIGSAIKSGETIGAVGNTGMSTGPHLHFELLINGEHVDPLPLIGTYKVIIVTEEDYEDYMFVGETFKIVETIVEYK